MEMGGGDARENFIMRFRKHKAQRMSVLYFMLYAPNINSKCRMGVDHRCMIPHFLLHLPVNKYTVIMAKKIKIIFPPNVSIIDVKISKLGTEQKR